MQEARPFFGRKIANRFQIKFHGLVKRVINILEIIALDGNIEVEADRFRRAWASLGIAP